MHFAFIQLYFFFFMSSQHHNNSNTSPNIRSMLGRSIPWLGFMTMLIMASNSSFNNKLSDHIADTQQYWNIIHIQQDSSLSYRVSASRLGGYQLDIFKNKEVMYSTKCTKIKTFCLGLQDNTLTPITLDFYARYQSTDQSATYNQLALKSVHYNDTGTTKRVDRLLEAPNSPKSLQQSKKSFMGFFVGFFFFYAFTLLLSYLHCTDDNKQLEKKKMYIFNVIAIGVVANYLYFIIQYLIHS